MCMCMCMCVCVYPKHIIIKPSSIKSKIISPLMYVCVRLCARTCKCVYVQPPQHEKHTLGQNVNTKPPPSPPPPSLTISFNTRGGWAVNGCLLTEQGVEEVSQDSLTGPRTSRLVHLGLSRRENDGETERERERK